ncbi:MAG: outer membrane lipoprotein carrier protein LolA [Bacteroidetes bacterium]|nr:outer membrane lipoprotein carrier protein LolA [Bacteroidota bacterium]
MKQLLSLGLLLAFVVTGLAQGNDPAAKKILDNVSAKFKTFKGVQAAFTLKVEDGAGKVQGIQKGTALMKGNKYRLSLSGKETKEIYCDGVTIWTFDKAANEVTIAKFDPNAKSFTPQNLMTNFYDKDFLYKLNGDVKVDGKSLSEIEMTPTDKTKNFHKLYVYVDKKTNTIYSSRVLDKSGNKYTYTVNSLKGNAAVADAMFVFDKKKYPGVDEVDLR